MQPITLEGLEQKVTGLDPGAARVLLDIMGLPETLACLGTVTENFRRALPFLSDMDNGLESDSLSGLALAVKNIHEQASSLTSAVPSFFGSVSDRPGPLHGGIVDFPIYAMFARKTSIPDNQLDAARAVTLISLQRIKEFCAIKNIDITRYASRIAGCCLNLRQLEPSEWSLLPKPNLFLDDYLEELPIEPGSGNPLYNFYLLVRAAVVEDLPGTRCVQQRPAECYQLDHDGDDPQAPSLRITRISAVDHGEDQAAVDEGCAPLEVVDPILYIETEYENVNNIPGIDEPEPSMSALFVRARRQRDYIIRSTQHLPKRWERLQPSDCHTLLIRLWLLAERPPQVWPHAIPPAELALFISVMFWVSAPVERILNLRLVRRSCDLPVKCELDQLFYALESRCWCLPVLSPELKNGDHYQSTGQARQLGRRISLPDTANIAGLFRKAGIGVGRVFHFSAEDYKQAAKEWIEQVNASTNGRLTLNRIEHAMFWQLAESTSDIAEAALALCHPHADANTYLHYYAPHEQTLRDAYVRASADYARELNSLEMGKQPLPAPPPALGHAGSPICPTEDTVRQMVDGLKSAVRQAAENVRSMQHVRDLHNAFCIYVAGMLGAATGYRSVRDPLNDHTHFDLDLHRAIIADKTDDQHHGTRIAILPDVLCQQLERYEIHLRALQPHLSLLNPVSHQKLKHMLSDEESDNPVPFLFLFNNVMGIQKVRPGTLKPYLAAAGYTLPTNSNRHYLRTKARESGASAEEISVIMGHWLHGQEPYGSFASTGLDEIEHRVAPLLDRILAEAGWEVVTALQ